MKKAIRIVLLCLVALAIPLTLWHVFSPSAPSPAIDPVLKTERQALHERILKEFRTREADSQHETLAGFYCDEQATLHIAVTDEAACTAYEQVFSPAALTAMAEELQTHIGRQHTVDELTHEVLVFETAPIPLSRLEAIRDSIAPCGEELGLYNVAISMEQNRVELYIEKAKSRAKILDWLSQNIDDFTEDTVQIVVKREEKPRFFNA